MAGQGMTERLRGALAARRGVIGPGELMGFLSAPPPAPVMPGGFDSEGAGSGLAVFGSAGGGGPAPSPFQRDYDRPAAGRPPDGDSDGAASREASCEARLAEAEGALREASLRAAGAAEAAAAEAGRGLLATGRALAERWAAVVGRPMLASELLRHLPSAAGGDLDECAASGYGRQSMALAEARQAHRAYLAEDLSEKEFLERHVYEYRDADAPGEFMARIEDDVLRGDAYACAMRLRLSKAYLGALGDLPHPDDVEYAFGVARGLRATVSGDEAAWVASRLGEELRAVTDIVADSYLAVLGRGPDPNEVRDEVPAFRDLVPGGYYASAGAGGAAGADALAERLAPAGAELRRRLHRSLEFHDVIKEAVSRAAPGAVPRRDLFRALQAVLEACGGAPETLTLDMNPADPGATWTVDLAGALLRGRPAPPADLARPAGV